MRLSGSSSEIRTLMTHDTQKFLPDPPTFTAELVERCEREVDFRPILFEWYKHVGAICNRVACLAIDSPAFRATPPVHFAVLIGLLNRCSRLMVANVRLSSTRLYGETTSLLDRCIAETATKVLWLCHKDDPDCFVRYLANSLKRDLVFKGHIEENIRSRGGAPLVIETRMLRSIQHCMTLSGLSEQEVKDAKKLPDFSSICRDLALDELFYSAIQRLGSHAVHGTWSELVFNYLRHEDGRGFLPRDHDVDTQDVQYIVISRLVIAAVSSFLEYVAADPSEIKEFVSVLEGIEQKLVEIQNLAWASDFRME
jgi:hypothetical protein